VSPRRKQSTKDLGAILSEAVPLVVAEEVQLPAGGPLPHPAAVEAPVEISAEEVGEPLGAEAAVLWRKSTIPFRQDQYAEIGHVLADFFLRDDVQLTIAEVVRLGLDKMIEALREPELREALLVELYRQQRRENLGNEKLKHSKSRGLGDYLAARGRLPAG